jgi:hypothetical protein
MPPLAHRQGSLKQAKTPFEEQVLAQTGLDTSEMKKLTDLAQLISAEQLSNQNQLVANLNAAQQRQMLNVQEPMKPNNGVQNELKIGQNNANLKNNVSLIKNAAPNVASASRPINMAQGPPPLELPKPANGLVNIT